MYICKLKSKNSMHKGVIFAIFVAILAIGCSREGGNRTAAEPVEVHRLDSALRLGAIPADSGLLKAAETLFAISGYGELTDSSAAAYAALPSVSYHIAAVDSLYPSLTAQEKGLGSLYARMAEQFPEVARPEIYAIISPFNQAVFTADSMLYLGLNHYLGADYPAYGYFPDFIRVRKEPARIPMDVAETLLRGAFPAPADGSAVDAMVYEGLIAQAVADLTSTKPEQVLGYTSGELKWFKDNEHAMWDALLTRRLLFSADPAVARGLTALSGVTSVLSPEAPGAAGRYIGLRIVNSYLRTDREASAATLLHSGKWRDRAFLGRSGYNP